ncbi:TetR/AcrR family transcriptional regulator [Protaetiibacter mangrovi]|uniref:TetR/AcrR family transcriptional regulator n=1 Tax=Protaetiibacter mangrovi TaxID=2970926 RepID=A0ABT1ZDW9_9MICO|nr:TetR/AcrR family transcriptional regulator [Protaetiibacter mangrovi]MCS0498906.1 TetR/AcrR family transcriptional regulator [Protaetiibacter mangrovi]TPX02828.1 TetR/AcrR family transcriptional regulator [Schumannella luteola]
MPAQPADARQRRTRAALHAAAIELAAAGDPGAITVTALAERAGVHRSTVYEHGGSPLDVLQAALADELDELRERHLRDADPRGIAVALQQVTLGVFAHVDRHAAVYRNLDGAAGATLHAFLSEHFQTSTRLLIAQSSLVVPGGPGGADPGFVEDATVRYIADGVVGLIAVWLHTAEPRDPAVPLALLGRLMPAWWPTA